MELDDKVNVKKVNNNLPRGANPPITDDEEGLRFLESESCSGIIDLLPLPLP